MIELAQQVDDIEQGEELYKSDRLGCENCHSMDGQFASLTENMWKTVIEERLSFEQFSGYSPEQYLIESILMPDEYIPEDYQSRIMPINYEDRLQAQELLNIVAFIKSVGTDE